MMHLLTPEEYAQIADALDNGLPEVRQAALAMLKAMSPVEPCAWQRKDDDLITAKEKRPDYAYTHYYDRPLYAREPKP